MRLAEDPDPLETREWLDSLSSVVQHAGRDRGLHLLNELGHHARSLGVTSECQRRVDFRLNPTV